MKRGVLRIAENNIVMFGCPGCKERHQLRIKVEGSGSGWSFNNNFDRPTFYPSVLVRSGHYAESHAKDGNCWCNYEKRFGEKSPFKCYVCHSYVEDGQIRFLDDCTHELAGKTVRLEDPDFV